MSFKPTSRLKMPPGKSGGNADCTRCGHGYTLHHMDRKDGNAEPCQKEGCNCFTFINSNATRVNICTCGHVESGHTKLPGAGSCNTYIAQLGEDCGCSGFVYSHHVVMV